MDKEITVCIIKPDVIAAHKKEEVIQKIKERGYEICEMRDVKMSEEQVRELYKHKSDSVWLDKSINISKAIYIFQTVFFQATI
jgi:nucleoside diphosphate kinase